LLKGKKPIARECVKRVRKKGGGKKGGKQVLGGESFLRELSTYKKRSHWEERGASRNRVVREKAGNKKNPLPGKKDRSEGKGLCRKKRTLVRLGGGFGGGTFPKGANLSAMRPRVRATRGKGSRVRKEKFSEADGSEKFPQQDPFLSFLRA